MTWIGRLLHRGNMEEQLDKELLFHLDQHAADLMAQGHNPMEARRLARLELGGPEQVREQCRDARGTRWLDDLWQDIRYGLRTLRLNPGFTTVALLTLALGIGASTIMFTAVDGVLLKPLPYHEPARLLAVNGYSTTWNVGLFGKQNLAYYDFLDCRHASRSFDLAGWVYNGGTVSAQGEAEYAVIFEVSSNLFAVLGVSPVRGRGFLPQEDAAGAAPVAIVGYSFWQRRFGGSPHALGATIILNDKNYTVIGVADAHLRLDGDEADVYTPLGQDTAPYLRRRGPHPVRGIARLRQGATVADARAELAAIGRGLAERYPDTNKGRSFQAESLRAPVGDVRPTLWLLLAAVTLVLLIGCANIASLLLARAISRERELAMRVALGAGRWRLVRQCLTESALLASCGGALGLLLAAAGLRPFIALWPGTLPRAEEVQLDWRVLLFAVGVSLLSGVLFGLAPALRVPVRNVEQTLRNGSSSLGSGSRRLHGVFVVVEMAIAVVLLVAAGIMGNTILRLSALDPGVNIRNVLVARVALAAGMLKNPTRTRAAWQEIVENSHRIPGVEAAAIVDTVPLRAGNNIIGYKTTAAAIPDNQQPLTLATSVTPDYLKVTGIVLRRGRFFTDEDRIGSESVVVIDDVLAQQAFAGQDPIGKQLWIGLGADPATVVGVVGHVRYWGPASDDEAKVRAQVYYPFAQVPDTLVPRWSELMSLVVRTRMEPLKALEALRRAARGPGRDQVLYEVRTFEQLAKESLARQRFLAVLFSIFAGMALLLACIGIYGVLAYLTRQRVPEIGLRMALGASSREVVSLVLRESMGMICAGVVFGAAGAFAAARVLARSAPGVHATEPWTFVLMVLVLVIAALAASYGPASRASRVDPFRALRAE